MKYFLQIIILINISVFADIDRIEEYYNAGQYKEAIVEAKAYRDGLANPKLHLLWAKSALALGEESEAMSAYERVILLDKDNIEVRIALVLMYRAKNIPELAYKMSKSLEGYDLTQKQKDTIRLNIAKTKVKASLSMGYDSNINIYPDNASLIDYNTTSGSIKEIQTLFTRFSGNVMTVDDLGKKGGLYSGIGIGVFSQLNIFHQYYDLAVLSVNTGLGYTGEKYNLYVPIGFSATHYLDEYLSNQFTFNPRLSITLADNLILNLNIRFRHNNYLNHKDYFSDGGDDSIGIGIYYSFGSNYLNFNTQHESYNVDNHDYNTERFLGKEINVTTLRAKYGLTPKLVSEFYFKFKNIFYYDSAYSPTNFDFSQRRDHYFHASIKMKYNVSKNFQLFISDMIINNDSNYLPGEYDKNIAMFGVSLKN